MGKLGNVLENKINDYSIRKKLVLFYVCCVLLPLFITDGVLFSILYRGEIKERRYEMESMAEAAQMILPMRYRRRRSLPIRYISTAPSIEFQTEYPDGLSFYEASREVEKRNFYETGIGYGSVSVVMCADNETIVNGSHLQAFLRAGGGLVPQAP